MLNVISQNVWNKIKITLKVSEQFQFESVEYEVPMFYQCLNGLVMLKHWWFMFNRLIKRRKSLVYIMTKTVN